LGKKGKALILLFFFILSILAGLAIWNHSTYIPPVRKDFTFTLINVGWEYKLLNRENREQEWNLFEGQINVIEGMKLRITINRNDDYKTSGFLFNNTFKEGDSRLIVVNQSYTIKAVMVETQLKKTADILKQNNITPIKINSLKRWSGFSSSLTYVGINTLNDFINFCQSKTEPVLLYRGRLSRHGTIWDEWDYYMVIEDGTLYYWKNDTT